MKNVNLYQTILMCTMLTGCYQDIDNNSNSEFSAGRKGNKKKNDGNEKETKPSSTLSSSNQSANLTNVGQHDENQSTNNNIRETGIVPFRKDNHWLNKWLNQVLRVLDTQNDNDSVPDYINACLSGDKDLDWDDFYEKMLLPFIKKLVKGYNSLWGERKIGNNVIYYGEFNNNKPNGFGILKDGDEWKIGKFEDGRLLGWKLVVTPESLSYQHNRTVAVPSPLTLDFYAANVLIPGIQMSKEGIKFGVFYENDVILGGVLKDKKLTLYNRFEDYVKQSLLNKPYNGKFDKEKSTRDIDLNKWKPGYLSSVRQSIEESSKDGKFYLGRLEKCGNSRYKHYCLKDKESFPIGDATHVEDDLDEDSLTVVLDYGKDEKDNSFAENANHEVIGAIGARFGLKELYPGKNVFGKNVFGKNVFDIVIKNGKIKAFTVHVSTHNFQVDLGYNGDLLRCNGGSWDSVYKNLYEHRFFHMGRNDYQSSTYSAIDRLIFDNHPLVICDDYVNTEENEAIKGLFRSNNRLKDMFAILKNGILVRNRPFRESFLHLGTSNFRSQIYNPEDMYTISMDVKLYGKIQGSVMTKEDLREIHYDNGMLVKYDDNNVATFYYKDFEIKRPGDGTIRFTKETEDQSLTLIYDEKDMNLKEVYGDNNKISAHILYDKEGNISDKSVFNINTGCKDEEELKNYIDKNDKDDLEFFEDEFKVLKMEEDIKELKGSLEKTTLPSEKENHLISGDTIKLLSDSKYEKDDEKEENNNNIINEEFYDSNKKYWEKIQNYNKIRTFVERKPNVMIQKNDVKKSKCDDKHKTNKYDVRIFNTSEKKYNKKTSYYMLSEKPIYTYTYESDHLYSEDKFLDKNEINTLICSDWESLDENVSNASKELPRLKDCFDERLFQLMYCKPEVYCGGRHAEKRSDGIRQFSLKGSYRMFYKRFDLFEGEIKDIKDYKNNKRTGIRIFSQIKHPKKKK